MSDPNHVALAALSHSHLPIAVSSLLLFSALGISEDAQQKYTQLFIYLVGSRLFLYTRLETTFFIINCQSICLSIHFNFIAKQVLICSPLLVPTLRQINCWQARRRKTKQLLHLATVHFAAHPERASGVQCAVVVSTFHPASYVHVLTPTTQRLVTCQ